MKTTITDRLEYLRGELKNESISTSELLELQSLAHLIDPGDVQLLEAAGVPEGTLPKKPKLQKSDVVLIEGRRWFEKTNGNTYHSCGLIVNNKLIDRVPFTYGYGNHYQQTGREMLHNHYSLDDERCAYNIRYNVIDVPRKKDL